MAGIAAVVLSAYVLVPGNDPRLGSGITERVQGLTSDPMFYLRYPAAGLGVESIPMAVVWLLPVSLLMMAVGAITGAYLVAQAKQPGSSQQPALGVRDLLTLASLALLLNVPVLLNIPRQGSPRTFTPTWLLLCVVAGLWAGRIRWRHRTTAGALTGLYLAGAALSLLLSAWVRVETADVVQQVAAEIADRTTDGDVVALCAVPRAAVSPAPRGAFAVQDYLYDWAAADALRYYTGRRAMFRVQQSGTDDQCGTGDEDLVVEFNALRTR
jgi:hypothetical protein